MRDRFPVLTAWRKPAPGTPSSIPWAMIAPHELQAYSNHGQTLERLAERGGLDPGELLAVLEGRDWSTAAVTNATVPRLNELIAAFEAERPAASPGKRTDGGERG